MSSGLYKIFNDRISKLDDNDPERFTEWEKSRNEWHLKTEIDLISISTVFLGIDHNHRKDGEPILFETMIFGGKYDGWQKRYSTPEEARDGHGRAVKMVSDTPIWDQVKHTPIDMNGENKNDNEINN